ncbi:hypothetical protein MPTK1_2g22450 [Marchantia polymorpha subsp. ruderalis]|uniref:Uncharacterized protein n=1 Tax=Marchantia polymorpha TaxID=3197 RepID=A0A2R6WNC3_MARPO|nr:hypothetical protein MARPO_0072s0086 [Marchantia polymorpha]BBN03304.1 hypothetical protein Mp_2g22450 [Marchantia polymorpha subsp. ruderalis]|eukprot:PTQ35348.1 hypothetical protein MARPO_0072s0086 [Marchantia polymorpha]
MILNCLLIRLVHHHLDTNGIWSGSHKVVDARNSFKSWRNSPRMLELCKTTSINSEIVPRAVM